MKLQSSKQKRKTIIIVALIVVVVLAIAAVAATVIIKKLNETPAGNILNPDSNEQGETGILISNYPKMVYYVGEQFDVTGANIQVLTTGDTKTYFVDFTDSKVTYSGFDSSTAGEKIITVTYKEFTTTFSVTVKEDTSNNQGNGQEGTSNIEVCDFQLEYTLERWNRRSPKTYGSYVKIIRPDGTVYGSPNETPITGNNIVNYEKVDGPCDYDLIIVYVDNDGTEYTATVTIKITN